MSRLINEFIKPKTEIISDPEYIQNLINVNLKKDLHDNEEVCPYCHGTGLIVVDNKYGLRVILTYFHISIKLYHSVNIAIMVLCIDVNFVER